MKKIYLIALLFYSTVASAQVSFSEYNSSSFESILTGNTAFIDLQNDNDLDLLIAGRNELGENLFEIYENNENEFSAITNFPINFEGCCQEIELIDVDADGDQDLILSRSFSPNEYQGITNLYLNENGVLNPNPFSSWNVFYPDMIITDLNGDGFFDILALAFTEDLENFTVKLINDGTGNFIEIPENNITEFWVSADLSDLDGDGDKDLATMASGEGAIRLYQNDASGNFSEINSSFNDFQLGDLKFLDFDSDGDNDLIITGLIGAWEHTTQLFENTGNWNFSEVPNDGFMDLSQGSVRSVDIDSDGDLDVFLTGFTNSPTDPPVFASKLYMNDGSGNFSELQNQSFQGIAGGSVSIGDVNNDDKPDIFLSGDSQQIPNLTVSKLYINNGSELFVAQRNFEPEIVVYPNPAENKINFETSNSELILSYRVIGMDGKVVLNEKIHRPSTLIEESIRIENGMYIIELETESNSTFSSRLIVRN